MYMHFKKPLFKRAEASSEEPTEKSTVVKLDVDTVSRLSFNALWRKRHSLMIPVADPHGIHTTAENLKLSEGQLAFEMDRHGRRFIHANHTGCLMTFHDRQPRGSGNDQVVYIEPRFPIEYLSDLATARDLLNELAASFL